MKSSHVREYVELFGANFAPVGGKLFSRIDLGGSDPPGSTTVDENTLNSERFYFFPQDTIEGVLANHALASAVRVVWASRLAELFPQRAFRCFVSNEYVLWPNDDNPNVIDGEGVATVLRLWSLPADHPDFGEAYRIDELAPDRVLWPEYDSSRLVPLSEVFEVIHGATHPARTETLRARWHAT